MKIDHHEYFERRETTTRVVELRTSSRSLPALSAAVQALTGELVQLGVDVDQVNDVIEYRVDNGGLVLSYEVDVDDVADVLGSTDSDSPGIPAVLPRDWPRLLHDAVANGTQTSGELEEVLRLVDGWVLGAVDRQRPT